MFKLLIISALVLHYILNTMFRWLNQRQPIPEIPSILQDKYPEEMLLKSKTYQKDKNLLSFYSGIFHIILIGLFLYTDIFDSLIHMVSQTNSPVWQGLFFFWILFLVEAVITIPFSLWSTFRVENKYGFNRMTGGLFIADFFKETILGLIISGLLLGGLLFLASSGMRYWFVIAWGLWFFFSVLLSILYPIVIAPLFNKFIPLEDEELLEKIKTIMNKSGITLTNIYRMDATKRSTHGNAYFTGLGKSKRIVLFDSLLEKHDHNEICAILAHEAGHWKKKHILKRLVSMTFISLALLFLLDKFLTLDLESIGLQIAGNPVWIKLWFLSMIMGPIGFLLSPIGAYFSRKHEYEADQFSVDLMGESDSMVRALSRLSKDNLTQLNPHSLVWKWTYSHPPILKRLAYLKEMGKQ